MFKKIIVVIAALAMIVGLAYSTSADLVYAGFEGGMPCERVWDAPIYSVNGCELDRFVQQYLYDKLREKGCEWWYPYALCQAYQESRFDEFCVNQQNFEDKGLFQYKEKYWAATAAQYGFQDVDIFNKYDQIQVYAAQIADRAVTRYSDVWYMISDHYTGGSGYSQQYVDDVMQWYFTMERKR